MKKLLIFLLVVGFIGYFSHAGFALDMKMGFVNISKAFDEYYKTKDFDKRLEQKSDVKQKQREELIKDIRKMRNETELLNEKARAKKQEDIDQKVRDLQKFEEEARLELTKERDNMVREILQEMNDIIQDYGKKNGYSIILNDRVLLYGLDNMDLTGEIIKILNKK